MPPRFCSSYRVFAATLLGLALAAPALAGPPLLCHPYDTGGARSLPWAAGPSWLGALPDYPTARLAADTQALLAQNTPVIVRMETLRRAAIYASRDPQVAAHLLSRLTGRALDATEPRARALAYLDAGYYAEALKEIADSGSHPHFRDHAATIGAMVANVDGYTLASKALALQPGDASLEFAAALIAAGRHVDAYPGHAERARAGAGRDPLLARNIEKVK